MSVVAGDHFRFSRPKTPSKFSTLGHVRFSPAGLNTPWKSSTMRWRAQTSAARCRKRTTCWVVAVHVVHLEAFDAHLGIVAHDALHVVLERCVSGPEEDAHVAFASVGHQLLEVELGHDLHQVGRAVHRPAVVDEDVLQSAAGGEVDIVFVGPGC